MPNNVTAENSSPARSGSYAVRPECPGYIAGFNLQEALLQQHGRHRSLRRPGLLQSVACLGRKATLAGAEHHHPSVYRDFFGCPPGRS